MKEGGFTPAVLVETSPGNLQAWMNHGELLPKELSTRAARGLAQRFGGDQGAADWCHFGRLSGFANIIESLNIREPMGSSPSFI